MKTLYILRHAHALPDQGGGDFARPLSVRGLEDSARLGALMQARGYAPALVLCSAAERTRQTLSQISGFLKNPVIEYDRTIYESGHTALLGIIQDIGNQYDSALLIGHNPSVHKLSAMLAKDDTGPFVQSLISGYAPCTLTVLTCPCAQWADLKSGANHIHDLISF